MKGKFWRKALAAALALLIVSGSTPIQPLSQVFEDIAITASAETSTSTITVGGTDYTLFTGFTATDGTAVNNAFVYGNMVDGDLSSSFHVFTSPAYVEFNSDVPIIPNGYIFNTYNASSFKPTGWVLKAKANTADEWTTLSSKSGSLASGQEFQYACDNSENNAYKYFRFEVSNSSDNIWLTEIRLYGSSPEVYYTHLTVRDATCTETGIKQDCYQRNDGKYFTDETGATELAESDVIDPMIPHTCEHHDATDVNIEYWECSMCHKLFSDEDCTTEITEEQTKIYRTITIDGSISSLVTSDVSQALAGTTIYLYVSDLIDASTLKVNDGAVELTAVTDIQYAFTMPATDVTVTADVVQSNADGDILTGSIRHTVTIADGANITLNNATISGSIVCEGSATITLVGTNSVSGATNTAGIQIGGSGTTLTIKGDGSLTANGGAQSAGIGLSRAWDPANDVIGGDIVIEGGNITANGGSQWGAGIGTGVIYGNGSAKTARIGNITIKGGTVKATGGTSADGIGTGYTYFGCTNAIGTVTIYDGIDKVDASSIKNSGSIVYKHEENDVTASTSDYFTIIENGNRRIIVQKVTPTIADVPDQTYTGSAITPEPLVQTGSLSLTKGTDYEYSYTNNTNVGTAKVTVTFKGDYASLGSVEKEFNIVRATPTVTAPTANTLTYNGGEQELVTAGSTDFGTVLYSLDGTNYSEKVPKGTSIGKYTVYYKVEGSDNWNAVESQTVTAKIGYSDGIGERLAGHSLSLTGNIGVNFYMELDDAVAADENAYMHFTLPNGKTQDVKIGQASTRNISGKTYYVFQCEVAAKEMTDTITAQMFSGDKSGEVYEYTVKEYADYILANTQEPDYGKAEALVKAMLNYGAYSQEYFGHNADKPANASLDEADKALGEFAIEHNAPVSSDLPEGVTFEGASLSLESETRLSLYFKNISGNDVTFKLGDRNIEPVENSGYLQINITGIKANQLSQDFTITVGDSGSVTYSPMNYCKTVLEGDYSDSLKNTVKALYKYSQAANSYFA